MARDEKGLEIVKDDALKLRFPRAGECRGVVEEIRFDPPRRGSKAKTGEMIVVTRWSIPFNGDDDRVDGVRKYDKEGYGAPLVTHPKRSMKLAKPPAVKARRRA